MLLTAIEVSQVRTLDVYEKQDLADTIIYQDKQLKAKDNRIAELEKRDKILCKALQESDEESNTATQKWIAETKILLDEKTALLAKVAELEAKLKPKTCDGCEYEDDKREGHCYAFHTHCSREPAADHYTPRKGE